MDAGILTFTKYVFQSFVLRQFSDNCSPAWNFSAKLTVEGNYMMCCAKVVVHVNTHSTSSMHMCSLLDDIVFHNQISMFVEEKLNKLFSELNMQ